MMTEGLMNAVTQEGDQWSMCYVAHQLAIFKNPAPSGNNTFKNYSQDASTDRLRADPSWQ